jgi:ribonuclease BN (tRNA processing enzyme)
MPFMRRTWCYQLGIAGLSALLVFCPLSHASDQSSLSGMRLARKRALRDPHGTKIVLLGTGTPNADPDRSGPGIAIVVDGTAYLVDSGPGIVRRAAAAANKGIEALDVKKLNIVFLTHLHSDHTLGLADLIFSPWILEREKPLEVYGPPGTSAMVDHLLDAYTEDIHVRIDGLEPANSEGYKVNTHDIHPGLVFENGSVKVRTFEVPHGSWRYAYGYRFETPHRTIVISGDTTPTDSVVEHCAGCDALIHEVYSAREFGDRPEEWQRYHASAHTSTTELAAIAARAKPGLLILYHQLLWEADPKDLLKEIREGYRGRVASGRDLDVYE